MKWTAVPKRRRAVVSGAKIRENGIIYLAEDVIAELGTPSYVSVFLPVTPPAEGDLAVGFAGHASPTSFGHKLKYTNSTGGASFRCLSVATELGIDGEERLPNVDVDDEGPERIVYVTP